jgi:hypothetical protein
MRTASLILVASLCAGVNGVSAAPAPRAIAAHYDVYMNGVHIAEMTETFESANGEYRLVSESHAVGLLALFHRRPARFVSSGRLGRSGLQPQRFDGQRGDRESRRVRGEFDWTAGRLTIEHDGRTEHLPLSPGTQDRLSVMYQFMFLAPAGPHELSISMTNGRKLDRYRYAIRPGTEIDTPLGRLATVHLVRQRRQDENATEVWLSPEHRHLPVKMTIVEENGSRYEQVATRIEITP